jgi:hypothetical protein
MFIEASFLQANLGILLTSYDYLRPSQFSTNTNLTKPFTFSKAYSDDDIQTYILPNEMKRQMK